MFIGDSRTKAGPGILPLQHQDYEAGEWPLWNRAGLLAVRLLGRFDNDGGKNNDTTEMGWWEEDPETRGDVIGGMYWQRSSREIGAWRFAWPVNTTDQEAEEAESGDQSVPRTSSGVAGERPPPIVVGSSGGAARSARGRQRGSSNVTIVIKPAPRSQRPNVPQSSSAGADTEGEDGARVPTTSVDEGPCAHLTEEHLIPIRHKDWSNDGRFQNAEYAVPHDDTGRRLWPKFPFDWKGIVLQADHEDKQEELFFPTDPRMLAVHCNGDEAMGSLVCDMAAGFKVDASKMARLQSAWKIAKRPSGCGIDSKNPSLTWNIGSTGCKDSVGGLIWELGQQATPGTTSGGIERPATSSPQSGGGPTSTVARTSSTIGAGSVARGGAGDNRVPGSTTDDDSGCPKGTYGHVSAKRSGPFELDCGAGHQLGTDGEGNPIFATHLSLNSYFCLPDGAFDGPLKHDGMLEGAPPAPYPVDVQFGYDPTLSHPFVCGDKKGRQRWRSGCFLYSPPTEDPPPDQPPPPPIEDPPGTPGIPGIPIPPITGPPSIPRPPVVPAPTPGGGIGGGEMGPGGIVVPPPEMFPPIPVPGGIMVTPVPGGAPSGWISPEELGGGGTVIPEPTPKEKEETARERLKWDRSKPGKGFLSSINNNDHVSVYTSDMGHLPFAASTMETAFPALLARPAMVSVDAYAWKNWRLPSLPVVSKTIDQWTPITGRLEAWGAQGPKTGDTYLDSSYEWSYTHKPSQYRYRSGTANGGFLVLPPEVGMEDIDNGFIPPVYGAAASTTIFGVGPGAEFGAGTPDLETGGFSSGYTWRDDGGDLKWGTNWYGSRTDRICFDSTGKVGIGEMAPITDLHVKNSEASPINADLLTIESSGNTTGDSFGIGFTNATGELTKIRTLQGAFLGGRLQFQTSATTGTMVRWANLDERGKWAFFDSTYAEKFTLDPIMDKFLTPDGSAADPVISFTADDDTGSYRPGSDQWAVATGGIQKFYLDRFGNAGFNTTVFGGGRGVIGIKNVVSAPMSSPLGGGVLYVDSGALYYRGSSGTVTTIAVA